MADRDGARLEYLREKARRLPRAPGVYIMENSSGKVIYVGKSRALCNRVYQYFIGTHDVKTERMASQVNDFRFIVCQTEIEALALENSLIKQHNPRYNIKLKDSRAYPYLRFTAGEYPRLEVTRTRTSDGSVYFGPYSGSSVAYSVLETVVRTLGLPSCKRKFPEEIGKGRPCIYYQTGSCGGVCTGRVSREEYGEAVAAAKEILRGHSAAVTAELEARMTECAEAERFEEAAKYRDSLAAMRKLGEKQKAVGSPDDECDVISFAAVGKGECAAVFYIRSGYISDSEHFVFGENEITGFSAASDGGATEAAAETEDGGATESTDESADEACDADSESPLAAFIMSLYRGREYIPSQVLISVELSDGDRALLCDYLSRLCGHRVNVRTPRRGDGKRLCEMAAEDALRHYENKQERLRREERTLVGLASLLSLEVVPERIEAYDISNFGDEHITAGMVVYENGRSKKSDYRYFRINGTDGQDDYGSMREALSRRLAHLSDEDGSYSRAPDLILLDGGEGHVGVICSLLRSMGLEIPVAGMVKDSHHKTRALVTEAGEVGIARREDVFRLVYGIQEEVHRFTVSRMSAAKRKTMRRSSLEDIAGIGPAKAKLLMAHFGKIAKIGEASATELAEVKGISAADAENIVNHFRNKRK